MVGVWLTAAALGVDMLALAVIRPSRDPCRPMSYATFMIYWYCNL